MAESEQPERNSSSPDAGGDSSAKKRRRRRGKRRPSGEGSGEASASTDGNAPTQRPERSVASDGQQKEEGGDSQRSSRSRRRKKKRPEGEGGSDRPAEKQGQAEAKDGTEEASDKAGKDAESGNRRGGRGRRDGNKGRPEKKERAPRGSVLDRRRTRGDATLDFPDDDTPLMPEAPMPKATSVDGYIKQLRGWQREVVMMCRSIIKSQTGDVDEDILWSQPVYSLNGPICYVKAFSDHVNLGFWRGNELEDPSGRLVGELPTMRHISIRSVNDVDRDLFESLVHQAVKLNKEKGDATA